VVDGVVNMDSGEGLARTIAAGVPVLAGNVAREGGFFVQARRYAGQAPWTAENYRTYLARIRIGDAVGTQYPLSSYASADDAYTAIVTDILACGNAARNDAAIAHRQPYFMFQFDDPGAPTTIYDVANPAQGPFMGPKSRSSFRRDIPMSRSGTFDSQMRRKHCPDRMMADVRAFAHGATMEPLQVGSRQSLITGLWTGRPAATERVLDPAQVQVLDNLKPRSVAALTQGLRTDRTLKGSRRGALLYAVCNCPPKLVKDGAWAASLFELH